jgi:hypothetical protein
MKLISQSEYARRKGVSKQRVNQWVKEGTIRLIEGKVDPEQADEDLGNNLDHGKRMDYDLRFDRIGKKKKDIFPDIKIDFSSLEKDVLPDIKIDLSPLLDRPSRSRRGRRGK